MKKSRARWLFIFVGILCLAGCRQSDIPEAEWMSAQDMEYEIVSGKDVPNKVHERIFHKQEERFGFTYRDGDSQYIAFGFGTMPTGGYSIQIIAVKDTDAKIVVAAELVAPQPEDVVSDQESCPSMILKVQGNSKNVQFRLQDPQASL